MMKAVSFYKSLPIDDPESFFDVSVEIPQLKPRDLLIEVRAISVNPVDAKLRSGGGPTKLGGQLPILGWDAAGVVKAVGDGVTLFRPGDEVYCAGSVDRPGSYAEFVCVDERIVGRKPQSLTFTDAAALPLTSITAWEMLFDRIRVNRTADESLLILGGAGGVGLIAIQLAKATTRLRVIATASRTDTVQWCEQMGADHVIDHTRPLASPIREIVPGGVNYVLALTKVEEHFDQLVEAMAPQSAIALIENPARPLDIVKLKSKSISLHWEFMFTRSRYETSDMHEQGRLLNELGQLVDQGRVRTTAQSNLGNINAANLRRAHAMIESGKTIGKIVMAGFQENADPT